jgi:hypothetical protein
LIGLKAILISTPPSFFCKQSIGTSAQKEDNYASIKEAVQRHAGEGEAVLEAYFDEVDFMGGKTDGQSRVICHMITAT